MLLAADTFGWSSQLPGAHTHTIQALLLATTLMQVTGPIWTSSRCATWRARPTRTDTGTDAMALQAFTVSEPLTLGVELELQLVSTHDFDLARRPRICCAC